MTVLYHIRLYREDDYESVCSVCRAAAPDEFAQSESGRTLYVLLFLEYYVQYEPEHVLVAEDEDGQIVGYAAASLHYEFYRKKMVGYIKRRVIQISYGEMRRIDVLLKKLKALHPGLTTHITFHVAAGQRHDGVGNLLLNTLSNHLACSGEPYMSYIGVPEDSHLHTYLEHFGFQDYGPTFSDGTVSMIAETREDSAFSVRTPDEEEAENAEPEAAKPKSDNSQN